MTRLLSIAFGIALLLTGGLAAQTDPGLVAQRAAQKLQLASRSLENAGSARDRVAALTETIRAYEEGLGALRQSLRQAAVREASVRLVFEVKRDQLMQLLGALQTMQEAPGPLLLLHPSGPTGTARAGMILSDVAPAMQQRAEVSRRELEEVALLRALQEDAAVTLEQGLAGVQRARTELAQALSERVDPPRRLAEDPEQMRALLDSSETLQAFASGLTDLPETTVDASQARFDAAGGALALPVSGTLLRGFDEADAAGTKRPGWLIATRPLSIVTAPMPATIRYRGPLLDYGQVVILEPGRDHLLVLAGLGTVYGTVGEVVAEGAPLGLMGGAASADDGVLTGEMLIDAGMERPETLYMELRDENDPVDPSGWFTLEKD